MNEVVNSETGILITTYEHLRRQHADLLDVRYQSRQINSQVLNFHDELVCSLRSRRQCRWNLSKLPLFCCHRWGYAVLDEGHRIRNPDADVTLMAKQLQTVHRCHATKRCILISSLNLLLALHTLRNDLHAAE